MKAMKTKMDEHKAAAYLVGIVGIVAAVGILVLIVNMVGGSGTTDLSGAAAATTMAGGTGAAVPTMTKWTTCTDRGNSIKLGNKEASTLVKKNVCTGTAVKQLSEATCVQDVNGGFSYKYTTASSCSNGKTCKTGSSGAYCG